MVDLGRASVPRTASALFAALILDAVLGGTLAREVHRLARSGPPPDFGTDLTLVATGLLVVVTAWATAVLTAILVATLRGRSLTTAVRWCPATWRPLVLAACGAGLALATATPGFASPGAEHPRADPVLVGLPHLDPPLGGAPSPSATPARPAEDIVVRPGDSLWSLASRRHPGASEATIARAVAALYSENRQVIGADPGLIVPGERLRAVDDTGNLR